MRDELEGQQELFKDDTRTGRLVPYCHDVDVDDNTTHHKEGTEKGKEKTTEIHKEARHINVDTTETSEDNCLYWG